MRNRTRFHDTCIQFEPKMPLLEYIWDGRQGAQQVTGLKTYVSPIESFIKTRSTRNGDRAQFFTLAQRIGCDPHDFVASAKRIESLRDSFFEQMMRFYKHNTRITPYVLSEMGFLNFSRDSSVPGTYLSFDDLIYEGFTGFQQAVFRFDPSKDCGFMTYAKVWVKQRMNRAIDNARSGIRLPVRIESIINQVRRAKNELMQSSYEESNVPEPSAEEIADHLELPIKDVRLALRNETPPVSLDSTISDESETTRHDFLVDTHALSPIGETQKQEYGVVVADALKTLTEREQIVIKMRFGLDEYHEHTLEEVGSQFHVTRERIRQIEAKALRKLRHPKRLGNFHKLGETW